MDNKETRSFNYHVEQFLGQRLPEKLAGLIAFPKLPKEARDFTLRMLSLMHQAGYPPTEFTPMFIRSISQIIPNTLPVAWGGRIPPITMPGRHQKFDAYVAKQTWPSMAGTSVFVDVGCGFPPQTTLDTARQFPDWQVIGMDRDFAPYIVYDHEGNYACYDRHGHFQYFQPRAGGDWLASYAHQDKIRERFSKLFADLSPLLRSKGNKKSSSLEKDGNRIIKHHIRDFETDNLKFAESDIQEIRLPSAHVIRCMNVFLYANNESRKKMVRKLSEFLCDGGILIAGTNGNDSFARYMVYRKKDGETTLVEFSFSPDNLKPFGFMPWFTIHGKDPEATYLAELTHAIRADALFWPVFSDRFDHLLSEFGICHRGADGFLHLLDVELSVTEVMAKMKQIWGQINREGYINGAVEALREGGYIAWQNEVGDIAVRPSGEVCSTL